MVSNSVKDDNQRRQFVLDMLKEPIGVWVGEEVSNAVSSPDVSRELDSNDFSSRISIRCCVDPIVKINPT